MRESVELDVISDSEKNIETKVMNTARVAITSEKGVFKRPPVPEAGGTSGRGEATERVIMLEASQLSY